MKLAVAAGMDLLFPFIRESVSCIKLNVREGSSCNKSDSWSNYFSHVKVTYELKLFACPQAFLNRFDRFSQNFEWLLYHHNVVRFTSCGQKMQYGRRANLRGWSSRSL